MNDKFNTILTVAILPQVLDIIMKEKQIDEIAAMNEFYQSKTYELLSDEDTKVWHFSPLALYNVWKTEKETGEIVLPEEGLL